MSSTMIRKSDPSDEPRIRARLERLGFRFTPADHAFWRARDGQTTVIFYKSGKLLLQGESTETAANLLMDDGIMEPARDPTYPTWIGTDESGKGDYFGPLTIAGVLVTSDTAALTARS